MSHRPDFIRLRRLVADNQVQTKSNKGQEGDFPTIQILVDVDDYERILDGLATTNSRGLKKNIPQPHASLTLHTHA